MSEGKQSRSDLLKAAAKSLAAGSATATECLGAMPAHRVGRKRLLGLPLGRTIGPLSAEDARNREDLEVLIEEIEDVEGRLWAVQRRLEKLERARG